METLVMSVILTVVVVSVLSSTSLWQSRRGATRMHALAFCSGLIGFVALPVALLGLFGVFLQPFSARVMSPTGLAFVIGTLVTLLACAASLFALIRLSGAKS